MDYRRPDQIQESVAKAQQLARARWRARRLEEARVFVKNACQARDPARERKGNEYIYGDLVRDASEAVVPFCPAYAMGGVEAARAPARMVKRWPAPGGGQATPPGRLNLHGELRPLSHLGA